MAISGDPNIPPSDKRITFDEVWQEIAASRGSVLTEAARIVHGPRQAAYGHPAENHARTAEFWNTYLNWRRRIHGDDYQLDAYDVCHLNDLQKTSRDIHSRQRDNLVDKVGFVANAEMVDGSP